jgi:hypothetical protein
MATTTPHFGWAVPTSTDLVKDGAVAIETLGDSIDASLVDLKGGTTGQVLAKASNTDMDFSWVAQDDSNAIQNAIVDAKGDLIGATAADTPARLAVGTNGQVLTADSTAATGLKWASPSAASASGCGLTNSTNQSVPNAAFTAITFNTESFDTNAFHDTSTNTSRITIPSGAGGKYTFTACTGFAPSSSYPVSLRLLKNGSTVVAYTENNFDAGVIRSARIAITLDCAAADYFELQAYQSSGGAVDVYGSGTVVGATWFTTIFEGA